MAKGLDTVSWYIATTHQLLGHDKTAVVLGQDPGDKKACVLCRYERGQVSREDVIERLGVEVP